MEILDVRPIPGIDEQYEPYLVARCTADECDWFIFDSQAEAPHNEPQLRQKACEHTGNVAAEVCRTLG